MNKLSKKQQDRRDELDHSIHEAFDELEAGIAEYNLQVQALYAKHIGPVIEDMNLLFGEARDFVDELHSDAENHFNERSEKWQEGEKGQEYNAWYDNMENVKDSIEDIDATAHKPDELTVESITELDREVMNEVTDSPEG